MAESFENLDNIISDWAKDKAQKSLVEALDMQVREAGRERDRPFFVTECGVLRRTFWQESRLICSSHVQRCRSFSERVGP